MGLGGIVRKNSEKQYFSRLEKLIILIGVLAIIGVAGVYIWNFYGDFSKNIDDWAKLGNFFSGILSPVIAFLALIGIVYAMRNSRETLELSRSELEETRKELQLSRKAQESQAKVANAQIEHLSIKNKLDAVLTAEKHLADFASKIYPSQDNKRMEELAVKSVFYLAPNKRQEADYFYVERVNYLGLLGGYFSVLMDYKSSIGKKDSYFSIYSIKYFDKLRIMVTIMEQLENNSKLDPDLSRYLILLQPLLKGVENTLGNKDK